MITKITNAKLIDQVTGKVIMELGPIGISYSVEEEPHKDEVIARFPSQRTFTASFGSKVAMYRGREVTPPKECHNCTGCSPESPHKYDCVYLDLWEKGYNLQSQENTINEGEWYEIEEE